VVWEERRGERECGGRDLCWKLVRWMGWFVCAICLCPKRWTWRRGGEGWGGFWGLARERFCCVLCVPSDFLFVVVGVVVMGGDVGGCGIGDGSGGGGGGNESCEAAPAPSSESVTRGCLASLTRKPCNAGNFSCNW